MEIASPPQVNFLVIGTQKGGTTVLNRYLRRHREIEMAVRKELHFFDNDRNFPAAGPDYAALHQHFDWSTPGKIHGETTPSYLYWEAPLPRIRAYNPAMKLIACLRNPVDRAFSHWNMETHRGDEKHGFLPAIQIERERIAPHHPRRQRRLFSYADRGYYARQIKRVFEFFPPAQVRFLKYEDFVADQEKQVRGVLDFLGVDSGEYVFRPLQAHARSYAAAITPAERQFLVDLFAADIDEVQRLLGWDCTDWKAVV